MDDNDSPSNDNEGHLQETKTPNTNIIPLTFKKIKQEKEPSPDPKNNIPLINLPPVTKILLGLIIAIHGIVTLVFSNDLAYQTYIHFGFIPGRFTGAVLFEPLAILTPVTHMLLHGSWMHLAMNAIMLMAFGTGIERWIGGKRMLLLFIVSSLCGIGLQFGLSPQSIIPVIGASGGLSGLFAAALIMIHKKQNVYGQKTRYGIWPFIFLWIGVSLVFGFLGSPDGNAVAWAAHIGGFIGGFGILKLMKI